MARYLGETVHYTPHIDHLHLNALGDEFAAIVGRMNGDGTADLFVLVPNQTPVWINAVPQGDTHHTHRSIVPPDEREERG